MSTLVSYETLHEEISDALNIANSALSLLYDRSVDLKIPPLISFYVLHYSLNKNIENVKNKLDDPNDHKQFFDAITPQAVADWKKETGLELPDNAHDALQISIEKILDLITKQTQLREPV